VIANPLLLRALLAAGVVFVVGGLLTWARVERDWRQDAEAALTEARATIAGRDIAIAALEERMADLAAQAAQRETIVRTIHAQPRTMACVGAPAVRALLDGLREPAAAAGGGAGGAAGVPPGAAGAGAGG